LATIGLGISQLLPNGLIAATSKQIVHSTIIRFTIKFLFSLNRLQNKPDERTDINGKMKE